MNAGLTCASFRVRPRCHAGCSNALRTRIRRADARSFQTPRSRPGDARPANTTLPVVGLVTKYSPPFALLSAGYEGGLSRDLLGDDITQQPHRTAAPECGPSLKGTLRGAGRPARPERRAVLPRLYDAARCVK
jgi:hypothetical protein